MLTSNDRDLLIAVGGLLALLVLLVEWFFWRRSQAKRAAIEASPPFELMSDQLGDVAPTRAGNAVLALVMSVGVFTIVLALEMVPLLAAGLQPRGPGWLVLPAMGSIWAWRRIRAGDHELAPAVIRARIMGLNREGRFKLILSGAWAVGCISYWLIERPYGYRFGVEDALSFVGWLALPPLGALMAYKAILWAAKGP